MKKKSTKNSGIVFFGVGFELVGLCIGGWVIGGYIDEHYGWKGTAQTSMVIILLIGWFVHLIYLMKKFDEDNAINDSQEP